MTLKRKPSDVERGETGRRSGTFIISRKESAALVMRLSGASAKELQANNDAITTATALQDAGTSVIS
jgi:hypothetical protein